MGKNMASYYTLWRNGAAVDCCAYFHISQNPNLIMGVFQLWMAFQSNTPVTRSSFNHASPIYMGNTKENRFPDKKRDLIIMHPPALQAVALQL